MPTAHRPSTSEAGCTRGRGRAGVVLLALCGVLAVLVGCAAPNRAGASGSGAFASRGSGGPVPVEPFRAADAPGVWTLTDSRNVAFNVRLSADGSAVSTWSAGPTGAVGERGHWSIVDGRLVMEWSTGWRDVLLVGPYGIELWAWGPGAELTSAPSHVGRAVRVRDRSAEFIGVWQAPGVLPGDPETVYVAMQADGMVFKTVGTYRYGCWSIDDRGHARITWANGWFDELRRDREGWTFSTWTPEANRAGAPTVVNRVRRVE